MTLAAGTRLGPYEIVSAIGAGGMGEVYRARDTRLGREVAIKVLPSELSSDRERLNRFEQEARSASALNHPNIVTVHDVGKTDSTFYIAMELVEGKTLRELVASGPLPLRKLLSIGAQVADGLAKAHAAGIVHRDLKPENLMVSGDGFVKILDFGLAKLVAESSEALSKMPTMAKPETHPGTLLGTVGYMSPEQAAGQPLDFRSDQFSFGSILYEMATGKRAFDRSTTVDTLSAILHEEPEPIGSLSPRTPAPFRWIVERCLAKDPAERYASTRDLARDLASVRDHVSEVGGLGEATLALRAKHPLFRALAGLALLALLLGVFLAGKRMGFVAGKRVGEKPSPSFRQLTFRHGYIFSARFAPDGHTIVYGAVWDGKPAQLFAARSESAESSPLPLPGADVLSISSSGEMAISLGRRYGGLGWTSSGTLARVPLAGGAPREILENVQEADWASDGASLAVVRRLENQHQLEFPIGKVLYTTTGWISHPRVSPKGDLVAFFDHPNYGDDRGSLAFIDRAGKKKTLSEGWSSEEGLAWSLSGEEVWFTATDVGLDRRLYAVTLSGQLRQVLRVPGTLTLQDIFRDGRILLTRETIRSGIIGLAPGETKERDLSWHDFSIAVDLSNDGKTLLFSEQGGGGGPTYAVYIRKTDGFAAVRLGEGLALALSSDKKWALSLFLTSPQQLVLLPTGAGEARPLKRGTIQDYGYAATWFPDGKRILFGAREPGRATRLYVQTLEGGADFLPRAVTPEGIELNAFGHTVSPDGKFVAAVGPDHKAWLYPVESGEPRPIPGLAAGETPIGWSEDGRFLYAFYREGARAGVYRLDRFSQRKELWKEITPADPTGILGILGIQVTPDGNSYAYTYFRLLSDLYLVEGLK